MSSRAPATPATPGIMFCAGDPPWWTLSRRLKRTSRRFLTAVASHGGTGGSNQAERPGSPVHMNNHVVSRVPWTPIVAAALVVLAGASRGVVGVGVALILFFVVAMVAIAAVRAGRRNDDR